MLARKSAVIRSLTERSTSCVERKRRRKTGESRVSIRRRKRRWSKISQLSHSQHARLPSTANTSGRITEPLTRLLHSHCRTVCSTAILAVGPAGILPVGLRQQNASRLHYKLRGLGPGLL